MQTRGRNERLAESGEKMILHGLRVAGESGRARASLGESRVSIEFKNGNCIDIRYDQILRMQHHNTTLVPGWVAFVGLCLFYASWRVITPPNIRLAVLALGLAMISGWVLTKRPTLTLDTKLGDCHVLHAIDSRLLKFSTMIQRMNDGLTLEEARIGVDLLNEDAEFPRQTAQLAAQALPVPVQDLEPARSIMNFLGESHTDLEEFEIDEDLPRWAKDKINQVPAALEESEPRRHGLIERGRANAGNRRGLVANHDMYSNPNHVSSTHFLGDAPLPIPMHQKPISSSRMIQEAASVASNSRDLELTPPPTTFLPSYVGPEGAHIPSNPDEFSSPDLPLMDAELVEQEPTLSLVEQGLIPHSNLTNPKPNHHSIIRRDSKGQRKRLQHRTEPKRRIASSRKGSGQESGRIFSSMLNRVRDTISSLKDEGIDEEVIEYMGEHIQEEETPVPSSFSALTESQEVAQAQMSQHGLRRID